MASVRAGLVTGSRVRAWDSCHNHMSRMRSITYRYGMSDLDLHSVRIVRAIAEHGTISGAARALGYSQPAISQHLRRAEARLGVPLLVRAGRGVRLTEPGQVLARHAI